MIHHSQLGTRCAQLGKIVLAGLDACGVRIVAFVTGGRDVVLSFRAVAVDVPTRGVEAYATRPVNSNIEVR